MRVSLASARRSWLTHRLPQIALGVYFTTCAVAGGICLALFAKDAGEGEGYVWVLFMVSRQLSHLRRTS